MANNGSTFLPKHWNKLSTAEIIAELKNRQIADDELVAALNGQPKNHAEEVVSLYIELKNQDKVAAHFKAQGIKARNGNVFNSKEVGYYIYDHHFEGDAHIRQKVAFWIYKNNSTAVDCQFN